MPLKRRLIKVGNSRAVVIPPDWLRYYEEQSGRPIQNILMELNNVITISIGKEQRGDSGTSEKRFGGKDGQSRQDE